MGPGIVTTTIVVVVVRGGVTNVVTITTGCDSIDVGTSEDADVDTAGDGDAALHRLPDRE